MARTDSSHTGLQRPETWLLSPDYEDSHTTLSVTPKLPNVYPLQPRSFSSSQPPGKALKLQRQKSLSLTWAVGGKASTRQWESIDAQAPTYKQKPESTIVFPPSHSTQARPVLSHTWFLSWPNCQPRASGAGQLLWS